MVHPLGRIAAAAAWVAVASGRSVAAGKPAQEVVPEGGVDYIVLLRGVWERLLNSQELAFVGLLAILLAPLLLWLWWLDAVERKIVEKANRGER